MLIADYDYNTDIRVKKQEAYEEGKAQQKAEDEKLLMQERERNLQQAEEIAMLKIKLEEALKK